MSEREPLLKTQQLAQALRVSASSIKRWVDAGEIDATRTVGNHRLIPLGEAIRFAKCQGLPLVELEAMRSAARKRTTRDGAPLYDARRDELTEALRRGDARAVNSLIKAAIEPEMTGAAALADHLIRPVMERVGHRWSDGALDVYHEHQASHLIASALTGLMRQFARSESPESPLALAATPATDPYSLSLLLGELVLREEGWKVRNLGANLPLSSLSNAVREYRPRLVFLSVSHLDDPDRFAEEYGAFYETASAHDVAVTLGGRALGPDLRAKLVCASFGERMAHLAEFARRLAPTIQPGLAAKRAAHVIANGHELL